MTIPGFERRDGQVQMAKAVEETLEHDGVLLVEAGTGIGKSLAYLVPAAIWSQSHGEPVIVSTFTRGLQEQLVSKDVPLASDALVACGGSPVHGVALKGRSNYLCLRRWMQESRTPSSDAATDSLKIKIAIWLESTATWRPVRAHAHSGGGSRIFSTLRGNRQLLAVGLSIVVRQSVLISIGRESRHRRPTSSS